MPRRAERSCRIARSGVAAKGLAITTDPIPEPTSMDVPMKIVVRVSDQKKKARIFFSAVEFERIRI